MENEFNYNDACKSAFKIESDFKKLCGEDCYLTGSHTFYQNISKGDIDFRIRVFTKNIWFTIQSICEYLNENNYEIEIKIDKNSKAEKKTKIKATKEKCEELDIWISDKFEKSPAINFVRRVRTELFDFSNENLNEEKVNFLRELRVLLKEAFKENIIYKAGIDRIILQLALKEQTKGDLISKFKKVIESEKFTREGLIEEFNYLWLKDEDKYLYRDDLDDQFNNNELLAPIQCFLSRLEERYNLKN
jgi:hypothetical protein